MTQASFGQTAVIPWTQRFRVDWRPEVRFLEARVELLRLLENHGQLKSFKLDETQVTVRLAAYAEMVLAVDHLELNVFSPLQPLEVSLDAARVAIDTIRPTGLRHIGANFAYLSEVNANYDELRHLVGAGLFPWWPANMTDWALLVDGVGKNGATYQCEFGIVADREIADRLTRRSGRTGGPPVTLARLGLERTKLPKVALFADSDWQKRPDLPVEGAVWDDFLGFVTSAGSEANEMVLGLQAVVNETRSERAKMGAS